MSTFKKSTSRTTIFMAALSLMSMCPLFSSCHRSPINTVVLYPIADVQTVYSAFITDQQAAINKYEGKTYQFPGVCIDQVPDVGDLLGSVGEFYVQSGLVKFRSDTPDILVGVMPGDTVFIIGTVTGMQFGYLNIHLEEIVSPPRDAPIPY